MTLAEIAARFEGFYPETALLWIVLLPLLTAVVNGAFGRFADKRLVGALAVGSVAAAFGLALLSFGGLVLTELTEGTPRILWDGYQWFSLPIGGREVAVRVAFVMDSLSGVMTLVITGIGLLIHIYSLGYMKDDPGYARFFAYLNLFTASMLILVLGSSLPVMFVGWEGVGLCSYLLIGFWFDNSAYAQAGKKAFIVNRIGDFGVLIGMFLLVATLGSFDFEAINAGAGGLQVPFTFGAWEFGTVATVACLFLFLGCTGKSAQIPLFVWLPDAMAGPTPVSALIHAATMVTAGVYLCCRLSAVFLQSPTALAVIALVGALTALVAASIALVQNQIKKILAYSTVSQLGFMFAAVGVGAFTSGFFHVFTHAFFKACLFLGAGSVMHAVGAHGDADIRKLGGLRKYLPRTHWTFLVSCLAIAGVPLFSGFFSKDEILLGAVHMAGRACDEQTSIGCYDVPAVAWAVFGILVVAATMTAFYMFRLYFLTFTGRYRSLPVPVSSEAGDGEADGAEAANAATSGHDVHGEHEHGYDQHPHESPPAMVWPLIILGTGAVVVGYLNLEPLHIHLNLWGDWLASSVTDATSLGGLEEAGAGSGAIIALIGGLAAVIVGIGSAYAFYVVGAGEAPRRMAEQMPALHRFLFDKWRIDELYERIVVGPMRFIANFSARLDKVFVDGLLTRLAAIVVEILAWVFTRVQNGVIYVYAAGMVVGLTVISWWFFYPHAELQSVADGTEVRLVAAAGLGYEYRWDLNGDGDFDDGGEERVEFDPDQRDVVHRYDHDDFRGVALVFERQRTTDAEQIELLADDHHLSLSPESKGPGWSEARAGGRGPVAYIEDGQLFVRSNDGLVRVGAADVEEAQAVEPGQTVEVGLYRSRGAIPEETPSRWVSVRVAALVHPTVEVRNAFGNVTRETVEVVVHPSAARPPVGDGAEQARLIGGGGRHE